MHASAAAGEAASARSAALLFITSPTARDGPRPSHKVKVTLVPAAPPLGWKTRRVRPGVLRRRALPPSGAMPMKHCCTASQR